MLGVRVGVRVYCYGLLLWFRDRVMLGLGIRVRVRVMVRVKDRVRG